MTTALDVQVEVGRGARRRSLLAGDIDGDAGDALDRRILRARGRGRRRRSARLRGGRRTSTRPASP